MEQVEYFYSCSLRPLKLMTVLNVTNIQGNTAGYPATFTVSEIMY